MAQKMYTESKGLVPFFGETLALYLAVKLSTAIAWGCFAREIFFIEQMIELMAVTRSEYAYLEHAYHGTIETF